MDNRTPDDRKFAELESLIADMNRTFESVSRVISKLSDEVGTLRDERKTSDAESKVWFSEVFQRLTRLNEKQDDHVSAVDRLVAGLSAGQDKIHKKLSVWICGRDDVPDSARAMFASFSRSIAGKLRLIGWGFFVAVGALVSILGWIISNVK